MSFTRNLSPLRLVSRIAAVSSLYAVSLSASATSVLEEIVVTAQKREQNLQDVGISVSAMSGSQMKALGLDNTQEITQQIPGLQIQTFTPGFTIFNLRGISQNNFQDNLEAPVAAYFDDVYVASMNAIGGQMFDMARTEVLRGPQGTLFGRNATGGLIHFVTRKADEDTFNGYIQAEISQFDSYNLEAAFGGALSESVRARVAARWEQSEGFLEPGPNTPEGRALVDSAFGLPAGTTPEGGTGSASNGSDGYAVRGTLQIDANESTTINLTASHSKDNDVPVGQYVSYLVGVDADGLGFGIEPGNPTTGDVHRHSGVDESIGGDDTGLDREVTSLTAHISKDFTDELQFVSITNWLDLDKSNREDGGGGITPFPFATEAQFTQWSQEFRLSGGGDNYRWQTGLYYLDIELDAVSSVGGPIITGSQFGVIDSLTELESTNWSVFAQAEYDLSDDFTVIAGWRWSEDDKEIAFQNVARQGLVGVADGTVLFDLDTQAVGAFSGVPEIDYGDFAARLQLNWQTDEETLVFASYNRGIKGGNWSPSSGVSIENFQHDEETLHAYEVGVKTTLADGMARLNATAFYYDYEDYQAFALPLLQPQVSNSDATSQGGEVELFLIPSENLDIILGASFIDSDVEQVIGAAPGALVENVEFPQAPGYSLNYLFRYNWDVTGGNVAAQIDGVYNDKQYIEGHNGSSSLQDSYGTTNASLSFTSEEGWELRAWVKNLTDEEWAVYSLDIGGFVVRQYAPPRWYGVTASYNF